MVMAAVSEVFSEELGEAGAGGACRAGSGTAGQSENYCCTVSTRMIHRKGGRISGMTVFAYLILAAGLLAWMTPFFLPSVHDRTSPKKVDRRARWGIIVQWTAFIVLWQSDFWMRPPGVWRRDCPSRPWDLPRRFLGLVCGPWASSGDWTRD